MITRTFSLIAGISEYRERTLKKNGIRCWDDFLSTDYIDGIPLHKKSHFDRQIIKAFRNLECRNAPFFYANLPASQQWRLYDHFRKDCAFLDIETTGLNQRMNRITTISVFDGAGTETLINGIDLTSNSLARLMSRFKMLVTFNGSMFDVPFIKSHFPGIRFNMPHMDLRWACRRVGLTGGLKAIEKQLGIARDEDIKNVSGLHAVRLWKRWELLKDKDALDTLVRYNQEDVINLKTLADHVYHRLSNK